MLGQLKELKKLRKLKKEMEEIEIVEEYEGVKITMNGSMKVLDLAISDKDSSRLEKNIRKCFNRAIKTVQKKMMENMGGLGNMLGQ